MDARQAAQIAAQERDAAASRAFSSEQAAVDRQFRGDQAGLDRQQQLALQQNSQEWQAAQTRLNQQFQVDFEKFRLPMNMMAGFSDRMQGFVTQVMSDPNLTPEARDQAIRNYQAYSQQTMGWMSSFFGTPMPDMSGGPTITPGSPTLPAPIGPTREEGPAVSVPADPGSVFSFMNNDFERMNRANGAIA